MYNLTPKARFVSSVGNGLFNSASLDLHFAKTKSLVDATTGANLVDFTRASLGTYVDSEGVIRTATTNLLLQSEDFSTTWVNVNSTETTNVATAPNGASTADKVIEDSATSEHYIQGNTITWLGSQQYTFSVFIKAAERTRAQLQFSTSGNWVNAERTANFDLSNGTIITSPGSAGAASITSAGNGWYRCSLTATTVASPSASGAIIKLISTGTTTSYAGDGTSGIYFWGAQLEQSTTVGEYIPTTSTINSAPRFDHDPTTGESLGLLVEEQRTNLLLQSEDFSTTWTNVESSENVNVAVAPNGTTTANALVDTTNNAAHTISQNVAGLAGNTAYTFSCYMKKGSKNFGALVFGPNASWGTGGGAAVFFNLDNGTVENSASATSEIQALPNGWYRCTATATTVASPGTVSPRVSSSLTGSAQTYTGDADEAIYIWGAQLEAGSFPTSYIPTTDAAATRAADVASISGSNFSSWYRQDEGTVFMDGRSPDASSSYLAFSDNSNNNRILYDTISTGASRRLIVTFDGVAQATLNHPGDANQMLKSSFVYKSDDFIACTSGTLSSADTSGTVPTVDRMYVGSNALGSLPVNGVLKRITYWPTRLSNATLQTITQ